MKSIINLTFSYNWNKRSRKGRDTGKLVGRLFEATRNGYNVEPHPHAGFKPA